MGYKELYENASKQGKLEDVSSRFVKFEKEGDCVIGQLLQYRRVQKSENDNGFYRYMFDTDKGRVSIILGASMDDVLPFPENVGKIFIVKYDGQEKLPNGHPMNTYTVQEIKNAS